MGLGDADILVEMEGHDFRPVDARRRDEMVEHLELARPGRHDDGRLASLSDAARIAPAPASAAAAPSAALSGRIRASLGASSSEGLDPPA